MSSLFNKLQNYISIKTEVLSGLTVALALVPEAIAFTNRRYVHGCDWHILLVQHSYHA
jgi:MFS superfamily sulfate permease-like transporter